MKPKVQKSLNLSKISVWDQKDAAMKKNSARRYIKIGLATLKRHLLGLDKSLDIRHMTFEITNLCNSKCEMCNIWANEKNDRIMTTEQIRKIFSDPALRNLEDVILTGGEAFLRDDVEEIVECIWNVNRKVNITVSTNGILAAKILVVAENLARKRIPVIYGISLDGIDKNHDKRRRVENNFQVIDKVLIPGLKRIEEKNTGMIKIGIGHCLDEYGTTTFEEVREYCQQHSIGFMSQLIEDFDYYLPEKKQTRSSGDWEKIHVIKKGFEGENRIMKKDIYSSNREGYAALIEKMPPTVHHHRLLNVLNGNDSRYECSSLRNFFLLRYDGAVTPCLRFCTKEVGNISQKSLGEVMHTQQRDTAIDEILKCDGCLNTWCTDWSMEKNAIPFKREVKSWLKYKLARKSA
jgi:MoaA/NifB/PqqE/SkfB family radical SAM enzyme